MDLPFTRDAFDTILGLRVEEMNMILDVRTGLSDMLRFFLLVTDGMFCVMFIPLLLIFVSL